MVRGVVVAAVSVLCVLGGCAGNNRGSERQSDKTPSSVVAEPTAPSPAEPGEGGKMKEVVVRERASGVVFQELPTGEKFAVYVPRGNAPSGGWPCIVFLNGSGECGTDGQRQLTQGLLPAVLNKPDEWPFVIVFPQKPTSKTKWLEHKDMVMGCLAQAEAGWPVDRARVYLTGLSQGGCGTWEIAAADKGATFAAVAPVCGFGEPGEVVPGLGSTPVWAFHGEKDDVVKPAQTRQMVEAISLARQADAMAKGALATGAVQTAEAKKKEGALRELEAVQIQKDDGKAGTLRMTIYPDLNHGCWDRAYRDSGMAAWFLRFRK